VKRFYHRDSLFQSEKSQITLAAIETSEVKRSELFLEFVNLWLVHPIPVLLTQGSVYSCWSRDPELASTKAFTAQISVACDWWLEAGDTQRGTLQKADYIQLFTEALKPYLGRLCKKHYKLNEGHQIHRKSNTRIVESALYLGRGYNFFPGRLRGALSWKEILYPAEGYCLPREMKHGPNALIDERLPDLFLSRLRYSITKK